MKRFRSFAAWLSAAIVLAACADLPVSSDYALDYDFSRIGSYGWLPNSQADDGAATDMHNTELMHLRYIEAINNQLRLKGLEQRGVEKQPDVLVTYHLGSKDKTVVDSFGSWYSHFGYYPCYHCDYRPGFSHMHFHESDIWVREFTEDSIVIDIIDARSRKMLWRGSVQRVQPVLQTPVERGAYVNETVAAILATFPPGAQPVE